MIEQQAPKQSIRAKFFFKGLFVLIQWLFIIFLAFFFIAGLILQAPRKVLTLIIVILTTLTIIPRLIRKWVWLTFGIIVVALAIWVFLPDDNEGWKPYTFDEESAALRAKYAVPDEQNAAIVYNKLLETYDGDKYLAPNLGKVLSEGIEDVNSVNTVELLGGKIVKGTFYPDFWNSQLTRMTLNNFWSSSDYPDIATWLNEKHTTTLQMLMHASSFDKYFSPFSPEEECKRCLFADSIDRISPFKHWSHLIIIAANNPLPRT